MTCLTSENDWIMQISVVVLTRNCTRDQIKQRFGEHADEEDLALSLGQRIARCRNRRLEAKMLLQSGLGGPLLVKSRCPVL